MIEEDDYWFWQRYEDLSFAEHEDGHRFRACVFPLQTCTYCLMANQP